MPAEALLLGALSGALIVVSGAAYAFLYALGKLRDSRLLAYGAYLAYALLAVCAVLLLRALNLEGPWAGLVIVMLAGYFLAPRAVWYLCAGTHGELESKSPRWRREPGG